MGRPRVGVAGDQHESHAVAGGGLLRCANRRAPRPARARRTGSKAFRILVALLTGACLAVSAAGPVTAAPRPKPPQTAQSANPHTGARTADFTAAACPTIGQRVKTSSASYVYLIGPSGYLYWIPNETVYFSLWDSWNGIVTNNDLWSCYSSARVLDYGELVKTSSSSSVYLYDNWYGGDRWIPNPAAFNKYAFSWSKIKTVSSIYRVYPDWS